jgi:TRAP-type C4-dicarboxylate transport system permease small subunit
MGNAFKKALIVLIGLIGRTHQWVKSFTITFKKTAIVFIGFIVILVGILIVVIQRYSQYGSIPDTMQMVDFKGILLAFLGAAILSLISVVLIFNLARAWVKEQPELSERIFRHALIINLSLIIIFGGLAGGIIILRTLWTIGYF